MNASRRVQRQRDTLLLAFEVKTTNPNNGSQGFSKNASFAKARRRKQQREATRLHMLSAGPLPMLPAVVEVTRVAPSGGLDPHDGLGAALKGIIDGIADAFGLKSDRDARVTWVVNQTRGPKGYYGVEIRITSMGAT